MRFLARCVAGAASLVALAIVACALFWYVVAADRSHPQASQQLVIQRGATFGEVATQLADAGVIGNTLTFRILARLRDEDAAVRAGEYRFGPRVTQNDVLHALVTGGAQVATWVTIPEGFTAEQIATRLQGDGLGSSVALRQDFMQEKLLVDGVRTKSLEGFLFPSTYLMPLGAAPEQIAALLTGQFFKELPHDAAARARALHVSLPQAVTVASLVEREAKSESDRPQIAAVIYNRL
ncbi:MAG: endolytic transglycosylase MltG, partial [Candidatus Cybelea sp.]